MPAAGGRGRRAAAGWAGRLRAAALLAAGLALASGRPARAGTVQLTGNQDLESVARLNNRGKVVWDERVDGVPRVYLWDGTSRQLISDPKVVSSWPWINDAGQVVWMGGAMYGPSEIFLWDGSTIRQLTDNPPPSDGDRQPSDWPQINNAGQVVWVYAAGNTNLFLWNGSAAAEITPGTVGQVNNYQLNGTGQVVWETVPWATGRPEIDLWNGSGVRQLTRLPVVGTNPQINDAGQVVWWGSDGAAQHLYFWDGAALHIIPTSTPSGSWVRINAAGQVIWESMEQTPGGEVLTLFLWNGSSVQRVAQVPYDGGVLPPISFEAEINDRGQIAWQAWKGHNRQIYFWDGTSAQQISRSEVDNYYPRLNNAGQVLWQSQGSTPMQIDDNRPISLYLYTPASPGSIDLSAGSVTGGHSLTATVTLAAPAPAGGRQLALTSDNPAATVPLTLTVPAGQTTATFTVTTSPVAAPTSVTLTAAAADGFTATTTFALFPPALADLSLDLVSLIGGGSTFGTVTLADPAPAGGLPLALASAGSAAAVPPQVTVPAGQTTAAFTITTTPVAGRTPLEIRATAGALTRSATLTLLPAPATAAPALSVQPQSLEFPSQQVGITSPAQTLTLINTSAAPLVVQESHLEGDAAADFSVPDLAGTTLAPGESRAVAISFTPRGTGLRDATLVLADTGSAPGSPHRVSLEGGGRSAVVRFSPGPLAFGAEPVGLSGTLGLLIQNTGDAPLTVNEIRFQGANAGDFSLATDGLTGHTLAQGEIALLNIRFSPTATCARSATLVLADDAVDSPQSLALTGTGTAPLLQLSASSLLFGLQTTGAPQTLTLMNNGDAPLQIEGLTLGGPDVGHFKIVSDTGEQNLAVGGSRTVQIAFEAATIAGAPRHGTAHIAATSYNASLEIKDNDPHPTSLHSVALIASSSVGTSGDTTPPSPTGSAPAAPSGLTVQVRSATEVDLTWTDNSSNEDAFAVWRQADSGDWTRVGLVIPNRTHFEDRTVTPGHSYTYRVRATTGNFASDWTSTVTVSTPPVPATPSGLSATVSAGPQVVLTWHNPQPDARLSLTVWRQDGAGPWTRVAVLQGDATTFTDSTVAVNGSYTYQVHLVDGAAGSPWSNLAHASTGSMALAPPSGLAATVGSGPQVRLAWSLPAPNPHAYLTVWRQAGSGEWARIALLRGDVTRFTDTSVQAGTSYSYHAHLVNDPAVSAWSNTVTVSTPTAGPAQLSATAGPGAKITLTWQNPHPDARAWVTVWRQTGSGAWTRVALLHGNAATFTDTQVTAGTSYRYRVHRVDGADVSDWSNEAAVLP